MHDVRVYEKLKLAIWNPKYNIKNVLVAEWSFRQHLNFGIRVQGANMDLNLNASSVVMKSAGYYANRTIYIEKRGRKEQADGVKAIPKNGK